MIMAFVHSKRSSSAVILATMLMLCISSIFQTTRTRFFSFDCQWQNPNPQSHHGDQETKQLSVHDDSNERPMSAARTQQTELQSPRVKAFSNLEIFLTTFPGKMAPFQEDENVYGFEELKETLIRTLQFFWPRDKLKVTTILDESTYSNDQERDVVSTALKSLFADDVSVNLKFNPLINTTLYGTGWYIQQLVMMWADNFTNAEYIGFVDDDTVISSAVQPYDLFDEEGRPRVIARAAADAGKRKAWIESSDYSFKRKSKVYAMTYFPVVVKREHFAMMREEIMAKNPEYSTFDEFFVALAHRGNNKLELTSLSQFCIIMDYLYEFHRDEYSWHFETSRYIENATAEMYEPFPRIAIHGNYLFMGVKRMRAARTLGGRRREMSEIMRVGYCYSLPSWNNTELNTQRCRKYNVDGDVHVFGEWKFEHSSSYWLTNRTKAALAHAQRKEHRREGFADHIWDEDEVKSLFGF